jgi:precorrin-2 C(20)-methyltransferase
MNRWLSIIGVGEEGLEALSPVARTLIDKAELLVGGARHHALVPNGTAERLTWASPLSLTIEEILRRRGRRVVVLATGDPMWFGIGVTLARRVPAEEMWVIPAASAFSLACGRLGWSLAEIECLTLHGRPQALLNAAVAPGARLLILSHGSGTPMEVAKTLTALGYGPSRMIVLERMGHAEERQLAATAADWKVERTEDLNTIAIECVAGPDAVARPCVPGLPDDAFRHDGQLTKREVRAATIATLMPLPGQLLWDVGAGCGSIAIEWLRCHDPRERRHPRRAATGARRGQRARSPHGPAAARCGLHRRRPHDTRSRRVLLVGPEPARPPRRQRRHGRGRSAAHRLARRARRRAHTHRRQPRGARRPLHRLAAADAGDPARGSEAMTGTVYGLGVGPGDPELITLKALRLLRVAPIIAYPAPETGDSFARSIVAPHLPGGQAEIAIRMPLGDGQYPKGDIYDRAAAAIADHAAAGRDVAVLCEGDPFFYGSFIYLYERLVERCPVVVVPGVSSLMACASVAGLPLAGRLEALTVIPAPLPDAELKRQLAAADAAAIIKVGRHFPRVRRLLEETGAVGRACYIERATLSTERVLRLAEVATDSAPYFSMILVARNGARR